MNKIYDLATQAGLITFESVHDSMAVSPSIKSVVNANKFAELIIQEFTKAIEAQKEQLCDDLQLWSEHDYGYEMAVNDSIEIVNKHFGIK